MIDKSDISSRADIDSFMVRFYEVMLEDELLKNKFDHIDLKNHLPRICDFWESVLFHRPTYSGSPFDVHVPLGLKAKHFDRWLMHFNQSLDMLFEGVVADRAKARAKAVAAIFKSKLKIDE